MARCRADTSDLNTLRRGCDHIGVAIPVGVPGAEKLAIAALALRDAISLAGEPTTDDLTVGNVAKRIEDIARFRVDVAERRAAASVVLARAEADVAVAWCAGLEQLSSAFAEAYNLAAAGFVAALDELEDDTLDAGRAITNGLADAHHRATEAATTLAVLAQTRDAVANVTEPTGILPVTLDRLGRIARVGSMETVNRAVPIRTSGIAEWSPRWFAVIARLPGTRLEWVTADEQVALAAAMPARLAAAL